MYRDVDHDFIHQLTIMKRECGAVESAVQHLSSVTLINGIGFGREGSTDLETNVPTEMVAWGVALTKRFLHDALVHLACFGFVAFVVDNAKMSVSVIEPNRMHLTLRRTLHGEIEYCATMRDDMRGTHIHDPRIHFCVDEPFDWDTGRCRGRLAVCHNEYKSMMVLARNEVVVSTGNAQPVFIMEHTDRKQVEKFLGAITPVVNDFEMSVPGYNVSAKDQMDARLRIATTIHLDDQKATAKMADSRLARLPNLYTDMRVMDANPVAGSFITAPVGRVAKQRDYAPESGTFVSKIVLIHRMIAAVFQVPCQITEKGVGNTTETLDGEMDMLKRTGQRYGDTLNMLLADVSRELLDPVALMGYMKVYAAANEGASDETMEQVHETIMAQVSKKGGPVRMRLIPAVEFREELQLFENWMLTWDAMKDILVRSQRSLPGRLEMEDPRLRIAELGGPGRKGASTLGEARHDTQSGSRGYTSERKKAKPEDK